MKHHKYTEEQKEFLRKQIEVCESYLQLTDAFNLTFSTDLTVSAIQSQCSKILKLKLGKNPTRYCTGGRPRSLPIGTIRTLASGMTYIKVSDINTGKSGYCEPDWLPIQKYVYLQNGGELAEDEFICFLDGNRDNLEMSNLLPITRKVAAVMAKHNWWSSNSELTKTGILCAKLLLQIS